MPLAGSNRDGAQNQGYGDADAPFTQFCAADGNFSATSGGRSPRPPLGSAAPGMQQEGRNPSKIGKASAHRR
jgi:hypothetical protein